MGDLLIRPVVGTRLTVGRRDSGVGADTVGQRLWQRRHVHLRTEGRSVTDTFRRGSGGAWGSRHLSADGVGRPQRHGESLAVAADEVAVVQDQVLGAEEHGGTAVRKVPTV